MINDDDFIDYDDDDCDDMREGCLFPEECCMPGPHYISECHTPLMMEDSQPCERSCTQCEGEPHHWIEDSFDDGEDAPEHIHDAVLVCKHCSTVVPMPRDWYEITEQL